MFDHYNLTNIIFNLDVHEMIQDFISYHWESLDLDSSGGLNFTEFKNLMARAALTDALTIMAVYDVDGDGLLHEAEAVIAAATFKIGFHICVHSKRIYSIFGIV